MRGNVLEDNAISIYRDAGQAGEVKVEFGISTTRTRISRWRDTLCVGPHR